uniref:Uncharacterized protein n=1 Tax=Anguilla anguilla TaxID=7936 RepID=A0A0E9Q7U8_ANGAN
MGFKITDLFPFSFSAPISIPPSLHLLTSSFPSSNYGISSIQSVLTKSSANRF